MTNEAVRLIAALCMVAAGDTNSMSSVVAQVTNVQRECHAFYAKCFRGGKEFAGCMLEREAIAQKEQEEWRKKVGGK